jgi:hypothetical protein
LTATRLAGNVNLMRRMVFAGLSASLFAIPLLAQAVPARDLLDFPIGALAEPRVFAQQTGDGFWNPATIALPPRARLRVAASALVTPSEQGVSAQVLAFSAALPGRTSVGISYLRAQVADLLRTDTDPQTIGGEIPYGTSVFSATIAQRRDRLTAGLAARYRSGQVDGDRRSVLGLDAGVVADDVLLPGLRFAGATFLWRPANEPSDGTLYRAGVDARLYALDSLRAVRGGYEIAFGRARSREHYGYLSGRYGLFEGHAGAARQVEYGGANWSLRLGIGLHYARYVVALAREDSESALGVLYQFTLSTLIK